MLTPVQQSGVIVVIQEILQSTVLLESLVRKINASLQTLVFTAMGKRLQFGGKNVFPPNRNQLRFSCPTHVEKMSK